MKEVYTLAELEALPTQCVGQADDLKIEEGNLRVWLGRCTVEDGEPFNNAVTIEEWNGMKWVTTERYEAT